jgi:hypothetical protein
MTTLIQWMKKKFLKRLRRWGRLALRACASRTAARPVIRNTMRRGTHTQQHPKTE